jgi:hypothetical protein
MINALATVFCGIMCVANVAAGHRRVAAILGFLAAANAAVAVLSYATRRAA